MLFISKLLHINKQRIFKNKYTIKMLYHMGLSNIIVQDYKTYDEIKKIEVLKFVIDNYALSKLKRFENFLTRFIGVIKVHVNINCLNCFNYCNI